MAAKKKTAPKAGVKLKSAAAPSKKPAPKTTAKPESKAASKTTPKVSGKAVPKAATKPEPKFKPVSKAKKSTAQTTSVKNASIVTESATKASSKKVGAQKKPATESRPKSAVVLDQQPTSATRSPAKKTSAKAPSVKEPSAKVSAAKEPAEKKESSVKRKSTATKEPTKPAKQQPSAITLVDRPVVEAAKSQKKAAGKSGVKQDVISKAQKTATKTILAKNTARAIELQEPAYIPSTGPIHGIPPYQPKSGEEYMSEGQLEHFRLILNNWRQELMEEVDRTIHHLRDEATNFPDPNDRATQESEFGLELRARDRERKLLKKIGAALERIEDGSYGYCEETGEEIGLRRLEARPIATLCLEAQERHELVERHYGERDDRLR
ncbi:MAG: RNA polymerase-binding protein DksA [Gammaproteobacteria bacterium]|nr:RNA polymerase-binding protein DksA [Gammaproteobacteria bacterium]